MQVPLASGFESGGWRSRGPIGAPSSSVVEWAKSAQEADRSPHLPCSSLSSPPREHSSRPGHPGLGGVPENGDGLAGQLAAAAGEHRQQIGAGVGVPGPGRSRECHRPEPSSFSGALEHASS